MPGVWRTFNLLSDFTQRCLSAPDTDAPTPRASLDLRTAIPLLREWVRATLARCSWQEALVAAASVSIFFCSGTPRRIDTGGLQFTLPTVTTHQAICEHLEASDRLTNAIECFHEMTSKLGGEIYASGLMTEWVSGEFMFYLSGVHLTFLSDFTHRCLSAPGSDDDPLTPRTALDSRTATPLLTEWVRATLARRSWKDTLVAAASVSIIFTLVPPVGLTH